MPASGGEPHRLTLEHASIPSPPAWTRDGHSIIFSSTRRSIPTLWEIPVSGGEPVQVPQVGAVALHPSVSPKGNRLAYDQILGSSSIWVVELAEIDGKNSRMQVTASKGYNWAPEFSPDGKKIVFESDRSGTMEIWTCKTARGSGPEPMCCVELGINGHGRPRRLWRPWHSRRRKRSLPGTPSVLRITKSTRRSRNH